MDNPMGASDAEGTKKRHFRPSSCFFLGNDTR